MSFFVKNVNGDELFKSQYSAVGEVVQEAVKDGADLRGADLYGALDIIVSWSKPRLIATVAQKLRASF